MGKASQAKKVARAATTGGGRTAGVRRPMGWYSVMAAVVILGVFLVAFSRNEELSAGQAATKVAPIINKDHWHSSFSVYICDHFMPNVPLFESADGIHTHGDGLMHIHPFTAAASGTNATLGFFVKSIGKYGANGNFTLSLTEIKPAAVPNDPNAAEDTKDWKNGDKCPDGKAGKVKFTVNGKALNTDPNNWRLRDGDYIDIGFIDADKALPSNPQEKQNLATINDVSTATGTTTPTTAATSATTVAPGATPTTATGAPATTTAPATTSAPTTSPPTTAGK